MKLPNNFPKELDIYFDSMDHVDIKTIDGGNANLRQFISRMLSYPDLVKALIVAWYGQLYFQVVSVSQWTNWTVKISTI